MPFDRSRYPVDWPAVSRRIRERENHRCAWCSRVVLTVAHVHDTDPMNCAEDNLAALCQRSRQTRGDFICTHTVMGYQIKCPIAEVKDKLPVETALLTILAGIGDELAVG